MKFKFLIGTAVVLCALTQGLRDPRVILAEEPIRSSAEQLSSEAARVGKAWDSGSLRSSLALYKRAAAEWALSGNEAKRGACLNEASRIEQILGDLPASTEAAQEALRASRAAGNAREQVRALVQLAIVAINSGKTVEADKYSQEALVLARDASEEDIRAAALFGSGQVLYLRRNVEGSISALEEAADLWHRSGEAESEANARLELAYSYMSASEPVKGLGSAKQALAIAQGLDDARGIAMAQIAVGHLNLMLNESQAALDSYTAAAAGFPDDVDNYYRSILFNGIATVYESYDELELSLLYRRKAMDALQKENNQFGQAATLASVGSVSYALGRRDEAIGYLTEGRRIAESISDKFYRAVYSEEFGNIYFQEREFEAAAASYNEALKLLGSIGVKKETELILDRLGQIRARQGDTDGARKYFEASLQVSRSIKNRFSEAATLYNLAELDRLQERYDDALEETRDSISITESLYLNVDRSKMRAAFISSVFDRYELYIELLMKRHAESPDRGFDLAALQTAERARARGILENIALAGANFEADAPEGTAQRERTLRSLIGVKADKLTDLLSQGADEARIEKISSEIDELEQELETVRNSLKTSGPAYTAITVPSAFDAADFQNNLPDDRTAVLEYSLGKNASYLWLITKSEIRSFQLPPGGEIDARVSELLARLDEHAARPGESIEDYQVRVSRADDEYEAGSRELSRILLGPVADKIAGMRLVIVPDGKLLYFPIGALPTPGAEAGEPLLAGHEVIYEPSAQTLSLLSTLARHKPPAPKDLLIFSDPVFAMNDERLTGLVAADEGAGINEVPAAPFRFAESLNKLQRLPGSGSEAQAVMASFRAATADDYSGFEASRGNLLGADLEKYKIIHFATHAFSDENRPELSGVILSRFDRDGRPQDEVVRLTDIYGLRLNADIVVLSGCETGKGKELRGEGLMSLSNAFLEVGARSVLATAWKVEDDASRELMENFYKEIADRGAAPAEALRQAQIRLWKTPQYRSPFYWAAFNLQGDPTALPQISRPLDRRLYLVGIVPVLALAYWLVRKLRAY